MEKTTILSHFAGGFLPFFRHYLPDVQKNGQGYKSCCPFHEDHNPSLSIEAETGKFFCHGCNAQGDIFTFYSLMKNLNPKTDFRKILVGIADDFSITPKDQPMKLINTYDYKDEAGKLLYQVLRYEPKTFRQRRPDEKGGWIYSMKDIRRVLYQLPDLTKADGVIIVEGEKDADSLGSLGFMATTASGGAGNWLPIEELEVLRGKEVILIPDNDEAGVKHMQKVASSLEGIAGTIRRLDLPGLPKKGDISDWIAQTGEDAKEQLSVLITSAPQYQGGLAKKEEQQGLKIINAAFWLAYNPPEPDQIIKDIFDAGDKLAVIGSSKLRKSFFVQQMMLSIAAGNDFLSWRIPNPRKVLYCQFELRDHHQHRRLRRMAGAMGITPDHLEDRLQIINARGLGIAGPEGIERVKREALKFRPEVIVFDPLYKLTTGAENAAEDAKVILSAFDALAEETGAAIVYVHHDAKGSPGDRDIRDRGAGSNVLGRDYDACITLTAHAQDPDAAIIDVLLRNYPPQAPFTIMWTQDNYGGYCFEVRHDLMPEKKTSKTKASQPLPSTYMPIAESILGNGEMEVTPFKEALKIQTGMSDRRLRAFFNWATAGDDPFIITNTIRGFRMNKKWVRIGRKFNDGK